MIFFALLSVDKTFLSLNDVGTFFLLNMDGVGVIPVSNNLNFLALGKLLKEKCSSGWNVDMTKVNDIRIFTQLYCSKYVGVNA